MSLFQAGLVERPALSDHLAVGAYRNIKGHAVFDAVVAGDDMLENLVDRVGLGLGEEPDSAEVDPQHRYRCVSRQLRSPQECAIAPEDEHELAANGCMLVGLHDVDVHPESPHFVGRQLQAATVDGFRRQHP